MSDILLEKYGLAGHSELSVAGIMFHMRAIPALEDIAELPWFLDSLDDLRALPPPKRFSLFFKPHRVFEAVARAYVEAAKQYYQTWCREAGADFYDNLDPSEVPATPAHVVTLGKLLPWAPHMVMCAQYTGSTSMSYSRNKTFTSDDGTNQAVTASLTATGTISPYKTAVNGSLPVTLERFDNLADWLDAKAGVPTASSTPFNPVSETTGTPEDGEVVFTDTGNGAFDIVTFSRVHLSAVVNVRPVDAYAGLFSPVNTASPASVISESVSGAQRYTTAATSAIPGSYAGTSSPKDIAWPSRPPIHVRYCSTWKTPYVTSWNQSYTDGFVYNAGTYDIRTLWTRVQAPGRPWRTNGTQVRPDGSIDVHFVPIDWGVPTRQRYVQAFSAGTNETAPYALPGPSSTESTASRGLQLGLPGLRCVWRQSLSTPTHRLRVELLEQEPSTYNINFKVLETGPVVFSDVTTFADLLSKTQALASSIAASGNGTSATYGVSLVDRTDFDIAVDMMDCDGFMVTGLNVYLADGERYVLLLTSAAAVATPSDPPTMPTCARPSAIAHVSLGFPTYQVSPISQGYRGYTSGGQANTATAVAVETVEGDVDQNYFSYVQTSSPGFSPDRPALFLGSATADVIGLHRTLWVPAVGGAGLGIVDSGEQLRMASSGSRSLDTRNVNTYDDSTPFPLLTNQDWRTDVSGSGASQASGSTIMLMSPLCWHSYAQSSVGRHKSQAEQPPIYFSRLLDGSRNAVDPFELARDTALPLGASYHLVTKSPFEDSTLEEKIAASYTTPAASDVIADQSIIARALSIRALSCTGPKLPAVIYSGPVLTRALQFRPLASAYGALTEFETLLSSQGSGPTLLRYYLVSRYAWDPIAAFPSAYTIAAPEGYTWKQSGAGGGLSKNDVFMWRDVYSMGAQITSGELVPTDFFTTAEILQFIGVVPRPGGVVSSITGHMVSGSVSTFVSSDNDRVGCSLPVNCFVPQAGQITGAVFERLYRNGCPLYLSRFADPPGTTTEPSFESVDNSLTAGTSLQAMFGVDPRCLRGEYATTINRAYEFDGFSIITNNYNVTYKSEYELDHVDMWEPRSAEFSYSFSSDEFEFVGESRITITRSDSFKGNVVDVMRPLFETGLFYSQPLPAASTVTFTGNNIHDSTGVVTSSYSPTMRYRRFPEYTL